MQPHYSWSLHLTALPLIPHFLLLLLLHSSTPTTATQIHPSGRLVVQEGQGFLVKLVTNPGFGSVKYCTFLYNSQPYFLHPGNENEVAYVSDQGETVQRFTVSECGAKVSNVSLQSSGTWQLGATSSLGVDASADVQLQVIPAENSDIESRTVSGRPGDTVVVDCSPGMHEKGVDGDHRFCEMWEEGHRDRGTSGDCKWTTVYPQLKERKEIRCRTFAKGSMEAVLKRWTVVGEYKGTTWDYLNGDESVVLRCKRRESPLTGCYIRNQQTNHLYRIANGLKGTRYSSFRSNLAKGLCQFEIPKPTRVDELGTWTMRLFYLSGQEELVDECVFTVADGNVFQV